MTEFHTYDFGAPPIKDLATCKVTVGPSITNEPMISPVESVGCVGCFMVFSPDSKLLAVAKGEKAYAQGKSEIRIDLWDTSAWEKVAVLKGHTQDIVSLAFSADSKFLVSGSLDTSARVWDVSERKK